MRRSILVNSLTVYPLLLALTSLVAYSSNSINLDGLWNTHKDNTYVEIKSTSSKIEGRIERTSHDNVSIGSLIIKDVKRVSPNSFTGTIYSFKYQRWFPAKMTRNQDVLIIQINTKIKTTTMEWHLVKTTK
jgi:uncharacterized protein (DUF2147 family)